MGCTPFISIYHDCGNQQFCCHRATFCLSVPARNQGRRIPGQRHVLELRFVATRSESKTTCYSDVQCIWMYVDVSGCIWMYLDDWMYLDVFASFFKDCLIQMLNIPKVLAKHQSGICLRLCLNWLQGFQLLLPTEVMSCISKWLEKKKICWCNDVQKLVPTPLVLPSLGVAALPTFQDAPEGSASETSKERSSVLSCEVSQNWGTAKPLFLPWKRTLRWFLGGSHFKRKPPYVNVYSADDPCHFCTSFVTKKDILKQIGWLAKAGQSTPFKLLKP